MEFLQCNDTLLSQAAINFHCQQPLGHFSFHILHASSLVGLDEQDVGIVMCNLMRDLTILSSSVINLVM